MSSPAFDLDFSGMIGANPVGLSCVLEAGCLGIAGASGIGKTTALLMMAGLLAPKSGHIRLAGTSLFDQKLGLNLPPEQRRLGLVFQDLRLFPNLSVRQNILFGSPQGADTTTSEISALLSELVSAFQLAPLLGRRVTSLSGGEAKRVAIARAVMTRPHALLLDEPFNGIDQRTKADVLAALQTLKTTHSLPMILVSHDAAELAALADQVVLMGP